MEELQPRVIVYDFPPDHEGPMPSSSAPVISTRDNYNQNIVASTSFPSTIVSFDTTPEAFHIFRFSPCLHMES